MGMTIPMSRRDVLTLGSGAALAAPFVRAADAQTRTVYVNSYGGVWETSWKKAFFEPFTAQTKIQVKTVPGVSFAKLKAQVQTRNFEWDVANLGDVEYAQAVLEGLLEKVDRTAAKADELPPEIVREYAITSYSLGTNIVYRKDKFANGGPQSWADFWDVKKFPGPRCMYDRSFSCLAFALLADGVPPDKLYPMDLDRAFHKMSELKPHIKVWWREGTQSQQLIRDGEVDMMSIWNGRANELAQQGVPVELVWNGAVRSTSTWCVLKSAPNRALAWELIKFASQPKPQAEFNKRLYYGPIEPAAFDFIPPEIAVQLPTHRDNLAVSVREDDEWEADRIVAIEERFRQWLTS
jgi:putative spermidine/putrescine transport system substrate-binding protein